VDAAIYNTHRTSAYLRLDGEPPYLTYQKDSIPQNSRVQYA
jgi:hypothetical protein